MGIPLESLAQHICGTVANGRVSSELESAWGDFFRPDYASLAFLLPASPSLVVAIGDMSGSGDLKAVIYPASSCSAVEALRKVICDEATLEEDCQPRQHPMSGLVKIVHSKGQKLVMCEDLPAWSQSRPSAFLILGWRQHTDATQAQMISISLRLLAKGVGSLFRGLYRPLMQDLSTGTYCGRLIEMPSGALELSSPKSLQGLQLVHSEATAKPKQLPIHMGYKRGLIRCIPRSERQQLECGSALAEKALPSVPEGCAPSLVPLASSAASRSSNALPVNAESRVVKVPAESSHVGETRKASDPAEVLKPRRVQPASGKAMSAKKVSPVQSQYPKALSSSSLNSLEQNLLPQNYFSLQFQDSSIEQQYQIFSAVQQARMDFGALLVTLMAAMAYGWMGINSTMQASPWIAMNPWVGAYGGCQLIYSAATLYVMNFHLKWYEQHRDAFIVGKSVILFLTSGICTAAAICSMPRGLLQPLLVGLQCHHAMEAWGSRVTFRWNLLLRLCDLVIMALISGFVGTGTHGGYTSSLVIAFTVLGCLCPLYSNRKAEAMERMVFTQLLAAGPKQLLQDIYMR
eukprot:jgi/Botrbrau1/11481/Bobra.0360s0008.1